MDMTLKKGIIYDKEHASMGLQIIYNPIDYKFSVLYFSYKSRELRTSASAASATAL